MQREFPGGKILRLMTGGVGQMRASKWAKSG